MQKKRGQRLYVIWILGGILKSISFTFKVIHHRGVITHIFERSTDICIWTSKNYQMRLDNLGTLPFIQWTKSQKPLMDWIPTHIDYPYLYGQSLSQVNTTTKSSIHSIILNQTYESQLHYQIPIESTWECIEEMHGGLLRMNDRSMIRLCKDHLTWELENRIKGSLTLWEEWYPYISMERIRDNMFILVSQSGKLLTIVIDPKTASLKYMNTLEISFEDRILHRVRFQKEEDGTLYVYSYFHGWKGMHILVLREDRRRIKWNIINQFMIQDQRFQDPMVQVIYHKPFFYSLDQNGVLYTINSTSCKVEEQYWKPYCWINSFYISTQWKRLILVYVDRTKDFQSEYIRIIAL